MPNRLASRSLALCLTATSFSVAAMAQAVGRDPTRSNGPATREQVREAVLAHRAAEHEQIKRDEAMAGRRLTAAERAELREQLRQEWSQRAMPVSSVQVVEPAAPVAAPKGSGWSWRSIFPWLGSSQQ